MNDINSMTEEAKAVAHRMQTEGFEPRPQAYGPHVKVVCKPASAPSCDLVVMVRRKDQSKFFGWSWVEVARFNDMSDDYAHTNAHNRALHERSKIVEGEA